MHSSPRSGTIIKASLIGHPVTHSRSPMIHTYWLKKLGISGSYDLVDLRPDELDGFVAQLKNGFYAGCNVTIPYKEAMFALVDRADDTARAVEAVNTVWIEGDNVVGGNTDVYGFLAHLDQTVSGWDHKVGEVVVLGAGGAARACVYGLVQRGMRVALINRTKERAEELAVRFGGRVTAHSFSEVPALLAKADLLVNTTSLGMDGKGPLGLDLAPLKRDAIVYDIVYAPLQTALLRDAAARGNPTVNGLGMLLHQAVAGFERWFGAKPTVTSELTTMIEADILAKTASR